jgi:phenylacetate-CoA ligase
MNRLLIRRVLYPAYRAAKRDAVLSRLREMKEVERGGADAVRALQSRKMRDLVRHAASHVPYYRRVFQDLGLRPEDFNSPADLVKLPVIRKRDILQNLDAMVSETCPRGSLAADSTSGSTGVNLKFYVDARATQARSANNVRMNQWIGIEIGDKAAFLWGTPFDVARAQRLKGAIRGWLSNTMILSHYTMAVEDLDGYTRRLERFRPDLVVGYPSGLTHYAAYLEERAGHGIKPRAIVVSGETMFEWQRASIEKAFGAPVYNHYGCREFGAIARECRLRRGLHLAASRVILEIVPTAEAPPGSGVGEIVITDLDNFGMPLVRYAIEDLGSLTWETCGCGLELPRLEAALGRVLDVVRAPNGNFLGGSFWTLLMRKVEGVASFQVVQEATDRLRIAIVPGPGFSEESQRYLAEKIGEACGPEMRVRFEIRQAIEPTAGGKHRFVVSMPAPEPPRRASRER